MLTEEGATGKWCPFARVSLDDDGDGNRSASINRFAPADKHAAEAMSDCCNCIASACMAWRWKVIPAHMTGGTADGLSDTFGYCGLAGKDGA